jgi:hypothetical protein
MKYSTQPSKTGLAVEGSLQFSAIGEYANIYRFIHRLETAQSAGHRKPDDQVGGHTAQASHW